jgi:hypothetical protein
MNLKIDFPQPVLFEVEKAPTDTTEHLPAVWNALEAITSPKLIDRQAGLDQLIEIGAPRLSPLAASVLAMRISDPDVQLRSCIVRALGEMLLPSSDELTAPLVRQHLKAVCAGWTREDILFLLEVVDHDPHALPATSALLNLCSRSGKLLTEIIVDRKVFVGLRQQAIDLIGRVGFLEAVPSLERLADRLASRSGRQQKMPFAPVSEFSEEILIPGLQAALTLLQAY